MPKVEQLGGLTKHVAGHGYVNNMNCYSISFGWPQELSIPQLRVNHDNNNNVGHLDMVRQSAPANCFMVFIGGKYVNRLEDIFQKVEGLSVGLVSKPIIYFSEKVEKTPKSEALNSILVYRFEICSI